MYSVKSVLGGFGVYNEEELSIILNSSINATLIADIMNEDDQLIEKEVYFVKSDKQIVFAMRNFMNCSLIKEIIKKDKQFVLGYAYNFSEEDFLKLQKQINESFIGKRNAALSADQLRMIERFCVPSSAQREVMKSNNCGLQSLFYTEFEKFKTELTELKYKLKTFENLQMMLNELIPTAQLNVIKDKDSDLIRTNLVHLQSVVKELENVAGKIHATADKELLIKLEKIIKVLKLIEIENCYCAERQVEYPLCIGMGLHCCDNCSLWVNLQEPEVN